jgi:hypothetical protein
MELSNNKSEPEPKPKPVPKSVSVELKSLSPSLEALPNDMLLNIFLMLNVWSIGAVLKTCSRFKFIIQKLNIKISVTVNYIAPFSIDLLDNELVRDLMYPLEFYFRNLGLPFSLEFKPVNPEREIESSSGYPVNVLLWVEEKWIRDKKASQSLEWFISEISKYPQTPIILLLKGDSIFFKNKELLQKVRELSSLKVLSVIDGTPKCWSNLGSFNGLELVYFSPKEYRRDTKYFMYIRSKTVWTISTKETTFIMNSKDITVVHSNNLE